MCLVVRSLGHVVRNQTYMMVVFHDICRMCCVYIRNVQNHIDPAVLKAARKEILIFHIRGQHVRIQRGGGGRGSGPP